MLLHFIRHTTPEIDSGICYGQTDLALASSYDQEMQRVRVKLLSDYDAVYTSPLQRCSLLAQTITAQQRFIDNRILEYNFGDWEMQSWNRLNEPEAQLWMDDFVNLAPPNGESLVSMKKRFDAFYDELCQMNYNTAAVVTHSGVLRLLHARILETPLSKLFSLQLCYGAVLEIKLDRNTDVSAINLL